MSDARGALLAASVGMPRATGRGKRTVVIRSTGVLVELPRMTMRERESLRRLSAGGTGQPSVGTCETP